MNKCFLPFLLLFVSCSLFDNSSGATITIQNQMDASIYIYEFSSLKDTPEFPVEIKADANCVFESDRLPEQYTFKVEINGTMYESETQYVQDWKQFSIVFEEKESKFFCTIDKDGRELELEPVDEA